METYQDLEGYPLIPNKTETISGEFAKRTEYFTPDIEDIRVGYECESLFTDMKWHSFIYTPDDFSVLKEEILNDMVRVPYLTKEQIEKEGWVVDFEDKERKRFTAGKNSFRLHFINNRLDITTYRGDFGLVEDGVPIFKGECKDINTFRYLSKLLGI